ncbi:MAG TPA: sigma 54-interacting transcriptional regulator [Byssovorax sp.]
MGGDAARPRAREDDGRTTSLVKDRGASHATVQGFWLRVLTGPQASTTLHAAAERVVVGTHASADLVLEDETVSRFHCELEVDGGRVRVRDLESRNGTLVSGVSVERAWLHAGATLSLGNTDLRFELVQEPTRIALSERERFGSMVGRSTAMRRVFALLERAAPNEATVLLEGETGTGKEVAAESIHLESPRRDGPFVIVDCSAVPADLLEAELFGHEKGAFTGASGAREGAFEAANGGTIFLDEIGELSLDLQPKLLRALERRHVKRVGANRYTDVDVRVVAATNRDLRAEVNQHRFRSDLYYRLAVIEVRLPPLRERAEDLPLLLDHVLERLGFSDGEQAAALRSADSIAALARHAWPGNVRELRNYVERCVALGERSPLGASPDDAKAALPDVDQPLRVARARWTSALERRYVEAVLQRAGGNVTAAARAAGVDRMYLYRLLHRYGLR